MVQMGDFDNCDRSTEFLGYGGTRIGIKLGHNIPAPGTSDAFQLRFPCEPGDNNWHCLFAFCSRTIYKHEYRMEFLKSSSFTELSNTEKRAFPSMPSRTTTGSYMLSITILNEEKLWAHKSFLAASIPHLKDALTGNWADSRDPTSYPFDGEQKEGEEEMKRASASPADMILDLNLASSHHDSLPPPHHHYLAAQRRRSTYSLTNAPSSSLYIHSPRSFSLLLLTSATLLSSRSHQEFRPDVTKETHHSPSNSRCLVERLFKAQAHSSSRNSDPSSPWATLHLPERPFIVSLSDSHAALMNDNIIPLPFSEEESSTAVFGPPYDISDVR
ncbi:hypothetical protein C8J56DRAFT_1057853 [Mycena floridula]|nr:hypothetical protein C8J56DRAFT_1057853 [Mycena floridula]